MDYKFIFKTIIVGDSFVGKSTILHKFLHGEFLKEHSMTIGSELGSKMINISGTKIKFQLWDTAGQEIFQSIIKNYFRNAICVLLCYDVTRKKTFNNVQRWLKDIKNLSSPDCSIMLVGTKTDKEELREVLSSDAEEFAKKNNMLFREISSKLTTLSGMPYNAVNKCFYDIGSDVLTKIYTDKIKVNDEDGVKYGPNYGGFNKIKTNNYFDNNNNSSVSLLRPNIKKNNTFDPKKMYKKCCN